MTTIPQQLQRPEFRFILVGAHSKTPIEKDWQNTTNYRFDDPKLIEHIARGGNYGVLCGVGNLIVIDVDTDQLRRIVEERLPKTFTVQTGSDGRHYYFLSDFTKKAVLKDGEVHLGEIQGKGSFVVGPGCIHPNSRKYEVVSGDNVAQS